MCGTACHLVDRVLPDTQMQWVLPAPLEVRRVMALRAEALSACNRIFVEETARWRKDSAGVGGAETGSVTFMQKKLTTAITLAHSLGPLPREETSASNGPRTSLGAGLVAPCYARIDWASLLRRIYLEDVLACPCGGRRRVLADVIDRDAIVAILDHLGLDPEAPPIARVRDPSGDVD